MRVSLLLSLLLLSPLSARENPFFAVSPSSQKVTSNIPDSTPPLGSVSYTLPDQARILKEVTLTYQNIDGSIETKKFDLDKAIDWHKPIILTQGGNPASAPKEKTLSSGSLGFLGYASHQKSLKLTSPVPLMRHFTLSNPSRIVLDFKHSKVFTKEEARLDAPPYLGAALTHHGTFARVTITLDGRYKYSVQEAGNTISILCK